MTENTSSITAPYFSVGEEVILESKDFPHYNREYVVAGITKDGEIYKGRMTDCPLPNVWYYDLGFIAAERKNSAYCLWSQPSLRKKYPPSEMSFSEMLENFNKENVKCSITNNHYIQ